VLAHQPVWRVPQVERDRQRAVGLDVAGCGEVGEPGPVRLRRGRDVCRCLGERVLRFGQADPVEAWLAATATESARGSAFPTSSDALMISRRAMNRGSSPAAIIAASQ
jgi:hypothetical protein